MTTVHIIGHGIDIVDIDRIQRMIDDHADRFLDRCFTETERSYNRGGRRYAEHIAARFAAKEAAMKALGTGLASGVSWTDFSIANDPSGKPRLIVRDTAATLASTLGIKSWIVSMSHTESAAVASVIACGQ